MKLDSMLAQGKKRNYVFFSFEALIRVIFSHLLMCAGENILEKVEPVEDTKANSGDCGSLVMTNLRIMWYSTKTAKLNLSKPPKMMLHFCKSINANYWLYPLIFLHQAIGYNCLVTISSKSSTNVRSVTCNTTKTTEIMPNYFKLPTNPFLEKKPPNTGSLSIG